MRRLPPSRPRSRLRPYAFGIKAHIARLRTTSRGADPAHHSSRLHALRDDDGNPAFGAAYPSLWGLPRNSVSRRVPTPRRPGTGPGFSDYRAPIMASARSSMTCPSPKTASSFLLRTTSAPPPYSSAARALQQSRRAALKPRRLVQLRHPNREHRHQHQGVRCLPDHGRDQVVGQTADMPRLALLLPVGLLAGRISCTQKLTSNVACLRDRPRAQNARPLRSFDPSVATPSLAASGAGLGQRRGRAQASTMDRRA